MAFYFKRNYDVLKSKNPCILLNKNINFNKNGAKSKMEKRKHSFRDKTLCFSSYNNRKLKVKLWWGRARKRKKRAFFVPFILPEGTFFNICVLSQFIAHSLSEFTYFYISENITSYTLLPVFKTIESLQCILKWIKGFLKYYLLLETVLHEFPHLLVIDCIFSVIL